MLIAEDQGSYSLQFSKDKKALIFTDLVTGQSTRACWWYDCYEDSGDNYYLLCYPHATKYVQQIGASEELLSSKKCKNLDRVRFSTGKLMNFSLKSRHSYSFQVESTPTTN